MSNFKDKIGIKKSNKDTKILMEIMKDRHHSISEMLNKHNIFSCSGTNNHITKDKEMIHLYEKQINRIMLDIDRIRKNECKNVKGYYNPMPSLGVIQKLNTKQ